MSSLMTAVLADVTPQSTSMSEEECLACFDMDAREIARIEGGWEAVFIADHHDPDHDELAKDDFEVDGPSVYSRKGYMIVRGTKDDKPVWFVYEPSGVGVH